MAEVTLIKQKIKEDKIEKLRGWMKDVANREEEAVETLKDEGVFTETAFIEETDQGAFLVTYMEVDELEQVWETFEDSDHEIDKEFKRVMNECLENIQNTGNYDPLYHITNPKR